MEADYLYKDKLFYVFLALVLLVIPMTSAAFCYQESANVSSGCGGLATGLYNIIGSWTDPENTFDEVWSSLGTTNSASNYIYVNYTTPSSATNSSLWQVKDGIDMVNLTLNNDCWI